MIINLSGKTRYNSEKKKRRNFMGKKLSDYQCKTCGTVIRKKWTRQEMKEKNIKLIKDVECPCCHNKNKWRPYE